MGRGKASLDESEIAELLAMKGEFLQHRDETAELRGEVDALRKDVHGIGLKQDNMVSVMDGVQKAVSSLNTQLATMADVLKALSAPGASTSSPSGQLVPDHQQANKEPAAPEDRPLTEEL